MRGRKIMCLYLFLFLIISNALALDEVDKIASETIKGFRNKSYEEIYNYFYIPPYYTPEDIKIDKKSVKKVLNIFNQELGDLVNYTEMDISKIDNTCLGAICGIGDSGFYEGDFLIKDNSNLYLKAYKAYFSKVQEVYVYIFIFNQRGKFLVTQFGVTFPPNVEQMVILKLSNLIGQVYCNKFRNKKYKVLADRLLNKESDVEYVLQTQEGQDIILFIDYPSGCFKCSSERTLISFPNHERPFIGEKLYHLATKNGEELGVRFKFFKNPNLDTISIEPPHRSGNVQEVFSIESKEGFIINVKVSWNNGTLTSLKVEPEISPFSGISYKECYAQN